MTQEVAKRLGSLRFVLADGVSPDDLASSLSAAVEAEGLTIAPPVDQEERRGYRHRTWQIGLDGGYAELVDDDMISTKWLGLCVPLPLLATLQARLAAHIAWMSPQQLIGSARNGDARDVIRMALGTNALWDEDIATVLTDATASDDPDVRAAAAEAMYLLHWPALLPVIRKALAQEKDSGVAAMFQEAETRYSA